MRFPNLTEGVVQALVAIGTQKLRSALTILGIVIGVTTVMLMASLVSGLRSQIMTTVEIAGPTTFYVVRFFSQSPLNPDNLPREVRIRPVLHQDEAEAINDLDEIAYSGIWIQLFENLEYKGSRTRLMTVFAADDHYMEMQGGMLLAGRFFTQSELNSGAPVVVLEENTARTLMGERSPLGKNVIVGGRPLKVIGLYQTPENIFQPPTQEIGAIISYETGRRYYRYDETNALWIVARPKPGIPVLEAQDGATVALRRLRGDRPGDPDTFDIITQDQVLDIFNKMTSAFFGVMIALSSVALMVGGIGVMAIMMVSVTDRTREIGVRKALGATRTEIMWQFLVEAATLTLFGGAIGVLVGAAFGEMAKSFMGFQPGIPWWSAFVACVVSIVIGLVFGLIPANRASKLDPVEALRYE